MAYTAKPLPFSKDLSGISAKTMAIHHDKLYAGYVAKLNEVWTKLGERRDDVDFQNNANQTYSELRALRSAETFAANGVYLHEAYFNCLGGNGQPTGELVDAIVKKWGSLEKFIAYFSASGMAMRGWVVLAYNLNSGELNIFGADAHNEGGVWGCLPVIVLDVYEHAYFIDYGADRKSYIADFWKNFDWSAANNVYKKISK